MNGKSASVLRDTGCTSILVSDKRAVHEDMIEVTREITLANGSTQTCPEV